MQDRIGKYEIEAEIGDGSLVKVFRASDRDTGRPVTLKLLTRASDRRLVELFRRKVATAAKLRHKNLIAIYELGEHEGVPFAAMQHLDEGSLQRTIRERASLPLLRKLTILRQVAEGLHAAHHGGLGSVGVRPSGIALGEDGAAIIHDFSIVRRIGDTEDEDSSYAAPEELNQGLTPDALCDIFAFGVICREFLPAADTQPDAVSRMIARAMEQNRQSRYQSIDELLEDAEPILCELRRARAATLLAEARRRQGGDDLEAAQTSLREVLELDAGNRTARRMLASVRAELQRRLLQSRIESLLFEASAEAAGRRFARAVEVLDSARQLDPANAEVSRRLEEMCSRLERSQKAAQLVATARQLLVEQKLDEAQAKAGQARQQDPDLPEITELLQSLAEARLLAQANSLLEEQSFEAAIAIVQGLRSRSRDSAALALWLDRAEALKAEAERQIRLQTELSGIRVLIAKEQFREALVKLGLLGEEFPSDADVAALDEQANEAMRLADLVRQALEEAQWLLDQDRLDLAAQFLREQCRQLPDQPRLSARTREVEQMIPGWETRRLVQDCLSRAAALEQQQQWAVALALVEQGLETCPAAEELLQTAARLRERQRNDENRKKLARRLEIIGVKMTAEAWPQALRLIEAAREEFPGEPALDCLHDEASAGLRRSECETLAISVRQRLADGDIERAEQILTDGLESLAEGPLLEALCGELETAKQQREAWRTAQVHFSRRQYREAEEILTPLAAQDRADAKALLEAARAARAANEEEGFFKRGHEQALRLIEQREFDQAADLLRNLLNLFPQDPILERELARVSALNGDRREAVVPIQVESAPEPEIPPPGLAVPPQLGLTMVSQAPSRVLWATLAGSVLLVSASAAVWKVSHNSTVQLPKAISAPAPALPKLALQRGLHGVVKVEATVGERGSVNAVRVLSGDPILAAAAQTAVRGWRFQPGVRNGHPSEMNVQVQVIFESGK